jgi:phage terminase large subunit-like protein
LIESAHQASTILSTGIVYVPESRRTAKSPVTWASELLDQFEKFPNDDAVELVDTFTRAMLYLRDSRLLELSRAELDDPEEYEKDYGKAAASVNPYAC